MQRVPLSQRSGEVIEPMLSDQWFVSTEAAAFCCEDAKLVATTAFCVGDGPESHGCRGEGRHQHPAGSLCQDMEGLVEGETALVHLQVGTACFWWNNNSLCEATLVGSSNSGVRLPFTFWISWMNSNCALLALVFLAYEKEGWSSTIYSSKFPQMSIKFHKCQVVHSIGTSSTTASKLWGFIPPTDLEVTSTSWHALKRRRRSRFRFVLMSFWRSKSWWCNKHVVSIFAAIKHVNHVLICL